MAKTFKIFVVLLVLTAIFSAEKTYAQRVLIGPRDGGNMNIFNQKGLTGSWNGFGATIGGTIDVSFNKTAALKATLNVFDTRNLKNTQTSAGVTTPQSKSLAYVTPQVMFQSEF